jgi:hypothetical protein
MMARSFAAIAAIAVLLGAGTASAQQKGGEQRCGWLDNPTPGNVSLHDKDGEWTIGVQGGHQAEGDWSPPYKPGEWRKSGNASYGYGCACLTVKVDAEEKNILEVVSAKARPLSACRKDKALSEVEKRLR